MAAAGPKRHRITVQRRSDARDSYNAHVLAWTTFANWYSSVEPLMGKEYFAGQERKAEVTTRFRLRYLAGLSPAMRILWNGRVFDIRSVELEKGIKANMVVMAAELVGLTVTE